jgi:hypothetical protein
MQFVYHRPRMLRSQAEIAWSAETGVAAAAWRALSGMTVLHGQKQHISAAEFAPQALPPIPVEQPFESITRTARGYRQNVETPQRFFGRTR